MPITRKQFELGINSDVAAWMKKIHAYLAEHKEQAFTRQELLDVFSLSPDALSRGLSTVVISGEVEKFNLATAALDKLVDLGVVLERDIKGETYYGLGERPLPV